MSILKGFPPSNTISPSVRITEKDLSFIAPEQSNHVAGLIGFASKGPVNLPTLISTSRQLHTVFGNPHPDTSDPFLIYAADQYLLVANQLYVVRVADTDTVSDEQALVATVDVPAAGTVAELESDLVGPYTFDEDSFFRWKLNSVLSTKTLVVLAGTYTTEEVEIALNEQLDLINDGIEFFVSGTDTLGVRSLWAYGPFASLELVSIQNAIYGGEVDDSVDLTDGDIRNNPTGLGTAMTRAMVTTGTALSFPLIISDNPTVDLVLDGTDNILIDQVVQSLELTNDTYTIIDDLVTMINGLLVSEGGDLIGGWHAVAVGDNLRFVTDHHGKDARIRLKPSSTALTSLSNPFDFDTLTHSGTSPSGAADDPAGTSSFGVVYGANNTNSDVSFTLSADSPGIDGNYTKVKISASNYDQTFIFEVYNNNVQVESWGRLTKDTASRFYLETYMALVSDYIRVLDNTIVQAGPLNGEYDLTGGSDGIPSDPDRQDVLLAGSPLSYTGIYCLSEPEQVDIDLIAIPGHSSTAIVQELLAFCRDFRQDCLAIVDSPFGLTVKEVVAWQNGTHPLNTTRFDSDFGALFWPWVKLYDPYNKIDVWCPPSGSVLATIARSDFLSAPWFAPAGLNRGVVSNITDVYSRPTLEERDLMYGNRNCVNPIVNFVDIGGFVIFGQKTLQRTPTALDRINVRRLMFYIEKRIRKASRGLLFDPNDDIFRNKFVSIATQILNEVKIGRGLTDFIIKADTELNTPDVIDRNEFRARIGVQPTRAAEFMFIEFSIHRTGSFAEDAATF